MNKVNKFSMLTFRSNFKRLYLPTTILVIAIGTGSCSTYLSNDQQDATVKKVSVTATSKGCEPNQVETTAGKTTFVITNKGNTPLEFEILAGVKVIEERENIAPSFVQEMKANLEVGEYDLICGKIGLPKGKLIVKAAPKEESTQAKSSVDQNKLVGAIAEYKVYVLQEVDQLVPKTKIFTDAVIANDIPAAQKAYAEARVHWERIEPIAELFSDLDTSIDARADKFTKKELDPEFTGFHRLEKALFQEKTTAEMAPIAKKLMTDTLELQKRIKDLVIEPKNMVGGASVLIEEVAANKITGEENRYAHTDLVDFQANIDGSQKIVDLLRPLVQKANPEFLPKVDANFTKVNQSLSKYKTLEGDFMSYEKLTESDKKDLKAVLASLSEDLSKLRGILGVD